MLRAVRRAALPALDATDRAAELAAEPATEATLRAAEPAAEPTALPALATTELKPAAGACACISSQGHQRMVTESRTEEGSEELEADGHCNGVDTT